MTGSPLQEDARLACDCDIAFVIRDLGSLSLLIVLLSRTALVDGHQATAIGQEACESRGVRRSIWSQTTETAHAGRLAWQLASYA
jgi:hypothetical protein